MGGNEAVAEKDLHHCATAGLQQNTFLARTVSMLYYSMCLCGKVENKQKQANQILNRAISSH